MLKGISQRERRLLIATITVLVIIGGYFGVYENLVDMWNELNGEINQLDLRLRASIENYNSESKIESEYEDVVKSLRIEGDNTDKQIKIMQDLNKIMVEAGISPKNAKPLNVEEAEKFQIFNFSYDDTETDMVTLTRFLEMLEKRSKVSEIQAIEVKTPSPPLYAPGEQSFKTNFKISRMVYRS